MVLELTSKRVDTCLHFSRVEISMDLAASLSMLSGLISYVVWINFKNEKEKTRLNHRVFNFFDCNFMNESILIKRTNERTKRSHSDLRSRKSLTWYPPSYAKTRARRPACRQGSTGRGQSRAERCQALPAPSHFGT